jgi:hypothetical protein
VDQLYKQSKEADTSASQIRALELLGKSVALFSDVIQQSTDRRQSSDIEEEIIKKLSQLQDQ